jgi:hypothetical protein
MKRQRAVFVVVIFFLATRLVLGQGIATGSISGTVLDQQGAVVPGANVRATQMETNRVFTTTSSKGGVVQLPSLPSGTYNLMVDMKGFATYRVESVIVAVGKDTGLGVIDLKVGNARRSLSSSWRVGSTTQLLGLQTVVSTSSVVGSTIQHHSMLIDLGDEPPIRERD